MPKVKGPGTPREPYRPSNGTEGMWFEEYYCAKCKHYVVVDNNFQDCELGLIAKSMLFDDDDPNYPKEWVIGKDGWGECMAWIWTDK